MPWKWLLTRNSLPINQRFTKVDLEIKIERDITSCLEIDHLVEAEVKVEIGEIITIETATDWITEIDQEADRTIIVQVIGATITRLTIDEVIIDLIMDKTLHRHLETEVKVEIELEMTTMTIQQVEVETEIMIDQFSQDKAHYLMGEMDLSPDPTLE